MNADAAELAILSKIPLLSKLLETDGMAIEMNGNGNVTLFKESEFVAELPLEFIALLAKGTQREVSHVCEFLDKVVSRVHTKGYNAGVRAGREAIVETVHELLGITKLERALRDVLSRDR